MLDNQARFVGSIEIPQNNLHQTNDLALGFICLLIIFEDASL